MPVRWLLVVVLIAAGATACSSSAPKVPAREQVGSITWSRCGTIQCGTLAVPLDHDHPNGRTISIALARRPASKPDKRIGVLFMNPGGPGASGVDTLRAAASLFPPAIRDRFDLVSWDPRGVGASTPVECNDHLDAFYAVDRSPDTPEEIQANVDATREFVASCKQRSGDLLPYLSTDATARDMDDIRAALGADKVNYLGFSYGTYLGALYAQRFPQRVRAMVLDGPVDPSLSYEQMTVQQSASFEANLRRFFDHCRAAGCTFAGDGDPQAAFERIAAQVDNTPIAVTLNGEPRTLGPSEFDIGVASALYSGDSAFDALDNVLAAAERGDGRGLLRLSDNYTNRQQGGVYTNATAASYAIGCLDSASPPDLRAVESLATAAAKAAPHVGPATTWLGLPCTYWPVKPKSSTPQPIRAPGAPRILVVGATGDPATPYAWAQGLTKQLPGAKLLTVDGDAHTSYLRGACTDDVVDAYLLSLALPGANARC